MLQISLKSSKRADGPQKDLEEIKGAENQISNSWFTKLTNIVKYEKKQKVTTSSDV